MNATIFTVKYQIDSKRRKEFLKIVKELKCLVKGEGLEKYSVFEEKGKENRFVEIYVFESRQAFEDFDDDGNERISILMSKLSDLIINHSIEYSTLFELEDQN